MGTMSVKVLDFQEKMEEIENELKKEITIEVRLRLLSILDDSKSRLCEFLNLTTFGE